jgi:hypothetical protein
VLPPLGGVDPEPLPVVPDVPLPEVLDFLCLRVLEVVEPVELVSDCGVADDADEPVSLPEALLVVSPVPEVELLFLWRRCFLPVVPEVDVSPDMPLCDPLADEPVCEPLALDEEPLPDWPLLAELPEPVWPLPEPDPELPEPPEPPCANITAALSSSVANNIVSLFIYCAPVGCAAA